MTDDKPKHPGGRPTDYNTDIADRICEEVASSTLGLSKICELNHEFPVRDTIYKWRYRHKEFADKYAEAKRKQAELMAEELCEIADFGLNDTYVDEDGKRKIDYDIVARSRLRVDTRKWIACKLLPKIYGEKNDSLDKEEAKSLMQKVIDKL